MKSSKRFKEGDKVIVKTQKYDDNGSYVQYLKTGIVTRESSYNRSWYYVKYDEKSPNGEESNPYYYEDLELEQVFHSPLYQALT